jgi:tetratricopeptide (TPR) repeat protein
LTLAIADLPTRFEGYYYRGRGHKLLGDDRGASEDLTHCLELSPSFLPAKVLLVSLERAGDTEGNALGTPEPDRGDPWGEAWLRAHQAVQWGLWEEAARAYTELLALDEASKEELFLGSSIENLIGRGVVLLKTGDFEAAKLDFWAARTLSRKQWGEFLEPVLLLGKTYCLEPDGDPSRGESLFRESIERSGERERMSLWVAAVYQTLVFDLEQAGRYADAVAAARKAIQFHPEDEGDRTWTFDTSQARRQSWRRCPSASASRDEHTGPRGRSRMSKA